MGHGVEAAPVLGGPGDVGVPCSTSLLLVVVVRKHRVPWWGSVIGRMYKGTLLHLLSLDINKSLRGVRVL